MCNKTNLYHNIPSGILNMKRNDNSCSIGILGRHQCPLMGFNTLKGFLITIWRKAAHASRLLILCVVHFMGVAMLKVCVRNISSTFNPCRSGFIFRDLIDKWYGMNYIIYTLTYLHCRWHINVVHKGKYICKLIQLFTKAWIQVIISNRICILNLCSL